MTERRELTCVSCGHDAGFNRAVVDTIADELVGGLCLHCERVEYGLRLDEETVPGATTCTFCSHDGFVALPKWQLRPRDHPSTGDGVTVGYAVGANTSRLCDGHFQTIADALEPALVDPTDEREPYEQL